jgi:hypothetical protein
MKKTAVLVLVLVLGLALLVGGSKWVGHGPNNGHGVWQEAGWAWDPTDGASVVQFD